MNGKGLAVFNIQQERAIAQIKGSLWRYDVDLLENLADDVEQYVERNKRKFLEVAFLEKVIQEKQAQIQKRKDSGHGKAAEKEQFPDDGGDTSRRDRVSFRKTHFARKAIPMACFEPGKGP